MWFDKNNPLCLYVDKREFENIELCDGRKFSVTPDVVADFTDMQFDDNSFYLVVFDPPHLVKVGETSYMAKKYGKLDESWEQTIKDGFDECMRVLKPYGTLIFKWNECQIPTKKIIEVVGEDPLFGHKSGKLSKTHWMTFLKQP